MTYISKIILSTALAINALFFPAPAPVVPFVPPFEQSVLGADNTLPLGGTVYTLSGSGVSSSATSITLTSLTIPQTAYEILDADVSATFYITLEPGNRTRQEIVSCTTIAQSGSDTTATLSGCVRGLRPFSPYTTNASYQFAHGGGTAVVFSNPPQLYNEFTSKTNDETITGTWLFPEPTNASSTATKNYADALAIAGAPDSSLTVKGIVEMATKAEIAAGTAAGGTSAPLYAPSTYYNASSTATTTVPVTNVSGKLHQVFLDLTEAFTFSGAVTHSATTTLSGANTFSGTNAVSGTSTITGAMTFSTLPTLTNAPVNGTDGANKTYADGLVAISKASGGTTLAASTSTLILTLTGHPASSTIAVMCAAEHTTNNQTVTFDARTALGSGSVDSCAIGSGTGNPGGCSMVGFVNPGAATTTTIYINNNNANAGAGSCMAFTL